jgi:hypothetical protein
MQLGEPATLLPVGLGAPTSPVQNGMLLVLVIRGITKRLIYSPYDMALPELYREFQAGFLSFSTVFFILTLLIGNACATL